MARDQAEKVAIIGLGLIGGSIGLALKAAKIEGLQVVGHDRDPSVSGKARRIGAIDASDWNLISAVRGANMVILATPVVAVKETLELIAEHLEDGCVVTDTASTKGDVMRWAQEILPANVHFIGGHPMAGKETPGIDHADAHLFKGATYCVFPSPTAHPTAVQAVLGLVEILGAKPYFLDADEHDGFVGGVSHLPLVLSAALVSATARQPAWREMKKLAASGYRDVTRLASGDPVMARDICLTNRPNLVRWIDDYIGELQRFKRLIQGDAEELHRAFSQSQDARDRWLAGGTSDEEASHFDEIPTMAQQMSALVAGDRLARLTRRLERKK